MDKLHREHEFVTKLWKFMKAAEQHENRDEAFWNWAEKCIEMLDHDYGNMSFVKDWLVSYMKFLEEDSK